ncbi:MAG: hypothetical protein ACLGII_08420 [Gammaproteobacteria bacterium]
MHRAALLGLGVLVVAALLAGSAWLVLMAQRHPDPPLDGVGAKILRMPLQPATASASDPASGPASGPEFAR